MIYNPRNDLLEIKHKCARLLRMRDLMSEKDAEALQSIYDTAEARVEQMYKSEESNAKSD